MARLWSVAAASGVRGVASLGFGAAFGDEVSGGVVDDGGAGEHAGFGDAECAEGLFDLAGLGVDGYVGGGAVLPSRWARWGAGWRPAARMAVSRLLGASIAAARSSRILAALVVEVITLS